MTATTSHGLKTLAVNPRGHKVIPTNRAQDKRTGEWYEYSDHVTEFLVYRIGDHDPMLSNHTLYNSCSFCDTWMRWELDETGEIAMAHIDCVIPNGMTTVVEIDVPSGKLICDDDLRDAKLFNDVQEHDYKDKTQASYNTTVGQAQVIERSAAVGLAYGPCLNTSPSLYEIEPGKYVVASGGYDEHTDEEINPEGTAIAGFCTDLWAFSMADYETYLAAGGKPIEEEDQYGTRSVIEVPPGRYRMTYHGGEAGFDYHPSGVATFAEFERIA